MKRYGEDFTLTEDLMSDIATYMDDDIREQLHGVVTESNEEFLIEYVKRDKEFEIFLREEFEIEMEE